MTEKTPSRWDLHRLTASSSTPINEVFQKQEVGANGLSSVKKHARPKESKLFPKLVASWVRLHVTKND